MKTQAGTAEPVPRVADVTPAKVRWSDLTDGPQDWNKATRAQLWDYLEVRARAYPKIGTTNRVNLAPDAERNARGQLKKALPSTRITSGPIFDLCRKLAPKTVEFKVVQLNRFTSHKECQLHFDKKNVGDSWWTKLGGCRGGALSLADGR